MTALHTIDLDMLSAVRGGAGADAANQLNVNGELDADLSGVGGLASLKVKGQGTVSIGRTDYGECLNSVKGRPTDEIIKACGTPGVPRAQ